MPDRPFEDVRPIGPFIEVDSGSNTKQGVEFESMGDLPDSPMLRQYIKEQMEYTGLDERTVINSSPVREYMKRLGVWDRAVDMNS